MAQEPRWMLEIVDSTEPHIYSSVYYVFLCLQPGGIYSVDILGKGIIHNLGGTEQGGMRFHHVTQNSCMI